MDLESTPFCIRKPDRAAWIKRYWSQLGWSSMKASIASLIEGGTSAKKLINEWLIVKSLTSSFFSSSIIFVARFCMQSSSRNTSSPHFVPAVNLLFQACLSWSQDETLCLAALSIEVNCCCIKNDFWMEVKGLLSYSPHALVFKRKKICQLWITCGKVLDC